MRGTPLPMPLQTLLLLLLTTTPAPTHAFENDFSAYPAGSQSCMSSSADASGCTGDTGQEMNSCLCTNGGNFIYNVASCVSKESPSDLKTVYATLQNNCDGTGVIITVGEAAFLAQASAATETQATATATPTTTTTSQTATATTTGMTTTTTTTGTGGPITTTTTGATSSPTSTGAAGSAGLSTGAKIGIGAGIAIGGILCLLGAVFIWVYNRRRRPAPGGAYTQTGGSPLPGEYSSTFGTSSTAQELHSPYPENSAIPLSASTGWNTVSPIGTHSTMAAGGMGGIFYKPQDAQQTTMNTTTGGGVGAGQPLLAVAELGTEQRQGPVELYAPHHPPDAGSHLTPGFRAELPGGEIPERYRSPPGSHSPYSPPYERSHF
ncbi:hypothetical protein BKA67DRAFT_381863 [Truncatella angustata]|uniref:Uncharacterized protein n=1 Tax=Truncatella angustata TaxID=152316 RepID=A0A9P8ZTS3_9PEZI|nr:uncharacterized protein BKA67DRAFT_381863 [Truncatella angustata]KAH6649130.1 hypothetical protein BKA67DRAFT_381863 [Truncatella angustata]KAH8197350.1 hypothetical protein TruAng_008480 [Truncatella angustata]